MAGDEALVIVPPTPGRLVRPSEVGRRRDDLDELIDELLPDTAEGPGLVDAGLLVGGLAVLGWSIVGDPPDMATAAGIVSVGLGCVLPMRAGWRRVARRRETRLLKTGTPLRTSHPLLGRLVAAYEALDGRRAAPAAAVAAAHGALLEVASLLDGRAPASERERAYVEARTTAVEELLTAVRELEASEVAGETGPAVPPDLVVEAREELDALGRTGTLSRLDDLTEEVRARARGG